MTSREFGGIYNRGYLNGLKRCYGLLNGQTEIEVVKKMIIEEAGKFDIQSKEDVSKNDTTYYSLDDVNNWLHCNE